MDIFLTVGFILSLVGGGIIGFFCSELKPKYFCFITIVFSAAIWAIICLIVSYVLKHIF